MYDKARQILEDHQQRLKERKAALKAAANRVATEKARLAPATRRVVNLNALASNERTKYKAYRNKMDRLNVLMKRRAMTQEGIRARSSDMNQEWFALQRELRVQEKEIRALMNHAERTKKLAMDATRRLMQMKNYNARLNKELNAAHERFKKLRP
jgi:chromosome segregation ATPase